MMAKEKTKTSEPGSYNWQLPVGLFALACVVGAVTLYMAYKKPYTSPVVAGQEVSDVQKMLARAKPLLEATPGLEGAELIMAAQARDMMQEHVRAHPDDVEIRPLLVQAYMKLGQTDLAEKTVDEVLKLNPTNAQMCWMKGELVRKRTNGQGNYMAFFKTALDVSGGSAEMSARYGLVLLEAGNTKDARGYLQAALTGGLRDGRTLGALAKIELEEKHYDKARGLLNEALTVDEKNVGLYVMLAQAGQNTGDTGGAERAIRQGLKLCKDAKDRGPLQMELGEILILQHRRIEAAQAFASAAQYPGLQGKASLKAAMCYYAEDKYAKAMEQIDQAVAINPQDPQVQRYLKLIEDARFGPDYPTTKPADKLLDVAN
jgi:tetratricopeptide (TPR) repeat protein